MKKTIIFLYLFLASVNLYSQDNEALLPPPSPPGPGDIVVVKFKPDSQIFDITACDTAPAFPGGDASMYTFLSKNIKYPEEAKNLGLQGKVFISFII